MIKDLMHDPIFLAGKSEVATKEDLQEIYSLDFIPVNAYKNCESYSISELINYLSCQLPIVRRLGLLAKGITAYLLIGIPSIGLLGAPISSFFCNAVIVMMNMHFVSKFCDSINVKSLFVYPTLLSVFTPIQSLRKYVSTPTSSLIFFIPL